MTASIITIGDEILIGQITDTNSAYIAKVLDTHGFRVTDIWSVSDKTEAIRDALSYFQDKVDIVIMTGGLGPTKDDVTKKTFCAYFEDKLVSNPNVLEHVKKLIEPYYNRPITQMNIDQALVPSKCTVLFNETGTAPGMLMRKGQTIFISLPGVPFEMKYLMEKKVLPYIVKEYEPFYNIHQTIITQGIGESLLAERIEDWENNLPPHISLSYLPSPGMVKLRLSTHGINHKQLQNDISEQVARLPDYISDYIISLNESEPLEFALARLLKQQKKWLSCAESCTGGHIAQTLTAMEGSSAFFKGSAITYATESKTAILGVRPETITTFSVVSEEVAAEMALGAQKVYGTDYALSTTGNAGPAKGDADAAVGTVCIGLATPTGVQTFTFNFGHPREKVILAATNKALDLLYKALLKK